MEHFLFITHLWLNNIIGRGWNHCHMWHMWAKSPEVSVGRGMDRQVWPVGHQVPQLWGLDTLKKPPCKVWVCKRTIPTYPNHFWRLFGWEHDWNCWKDWDPCMLYMVTFTINIPPMLVYIPYMDPMGKELPLVLTKDFLCVISGWPGCHGNTASSSAARSGSTVTWHRWFSGGGTPST